MLYKKTRESLKKSQVVIKKCNWVALPQRCLEAHCEGPGIAIPRPGALMVCLVMEKGGDKRCSPEIDCNLYLKQVFNKYDMTKLHCKHYKIEKQQYCKTAV